MIDRAHETLEWPSVVFRLPAHTPVIRELSELESLFDPKAECLQLSLDPFSATATVSNIDSIRLIAHRSKTSFRIRRSARPGILTIGYANSAGAVTQWGSLRTSGDLIAIGEDAVDIVLPKVSDFIWLEVDIAAAGDERLLSLRPPQRRSAVLTPAGARRSRELRGYVTSIMQMVAADPPLLRDSRMRADLQKNLLERLVRALTGAQEIVADPKAEKVAALVRQAEHFMWDNVEEPITLQRICEATHSRPRRLIYCFKRAFDLGPIAYLKLRRLDAAHRRLIETRGKARIADIAADFGFWHMGHFSADYKRMFGSTASQTIEAARARFGEAES